MFTILARFIMALIVRFFWRIVAKKQLPILKYMIVSFIAIIVLKLILGADHSSIIDFVSCIGICWFLTKDQPKIGSQQGNYPPRGNNPSNYNRR